MSAAALDVFAPDPEFGDEEHIGKVRVIDRRGAELVVWTPQEAREFAERLSSVAAHAEGLARTVVDLADLTHPGDGGGPIAYPEPDVFEHAHCRCGVPIVRRLECMHCGEPIKRVDTLDGVGVYTHVVGSAPHDHHSCYDDPGEPGAEPDPAGWEHDAPESVWGGDHDARPDGAS